MHYKQIPHSLLSPEVVTYPLPCKAAQNAKLINNFSLMNNSCFCRGWHEFRSLIASICFNDSTDNESTRIKLNGPNIGKLLKHIPLCTYRALSELLIWLKKN
jgi:hypothetical protein